jgi:hypothetical protein
MSRAGTSFAARIPHTGAKTMQNLIEQYRRYPTAKNAELLRDYFERNPSRIWLLQVDLMPLLAAAGVRALHI